MDKLCRFRKCCVGHPEVVEACVIGVAHEKWDERPLLIVIPANKGLQGICL